MTCEFERFLAHARRSQSAPAVIFGASVNGLSYVRSLGRRKVPVLCVDTQVNTASASRFGAFQLLSVSASDDVPGKAAADELLQRFLQEGIRPVLLASADEWQLYIARQVAMGKDGFSHLSPSIETLEQITDKQTQYERAVECDVPVAAFANAKQVMDGSSDWNQFPAIIKPRWSFLGRKAIGGKATLVSSRQELSRRLQELALVSDVSAYLVQAVVQGGDNCLFAYLGCFDREGAEVAHVIKRKLRQQPPSFGDGSLDMTCEDAGFGDCARRLLMTLNYQGLVGVEFKQDSASGSFWLIEINPRTVSTNQLAITAGVDFPWLGYQLAIDGSVPQPRGGAEGNYRLGVRHVHEEREFRGFWPRRRQGETTWLRWVTEMLRADSYAIWSWRDPWPFLKTITGGVARKFRN